jgi:uncharacterized protein YggU (UPF0235/DUF167 family)
VRAGAAWARSRPGGITLHLRVTPKAGLDSIDGPETRPDGMAVLRVRVRAIADRGAANAAVIGLVADALGVSRGAVRLKAGATSRLKTLEIAGEPESLLARAASLVGPGGPAA